MRIFLNKILPFWPVVVLAALSLVLAWRNILPHTFLVGWDATMPELNPSLNFWRFIFPVWQTYRGLGTADGMAHGANIVYWLYTTLAHFILPPWSIRYFFQLLFHFLGGVGVYVLLVTEVFPHHETKKSKSLLSFFPLSLAGLLASVLYMFNFMTIQMFYIPLEAFSIHFFALPWSIWSLLRYFRTGKRKDFWIFSLVQLITLSQAHIPTIFISYSFALSIFLLIGLFIKKNRKKVLSIFLVLFIINAFWGLPYVYSALTKSGDIAKTRINQFSTDDIFYRNLAWGDSYSLATFGGFNVDYFDWNMKTRDSELMMGPWIDQIKTPQYIFVSLFMTASGVVGALFFLITGIHKRKWQYIAFSTSFVLFLIFLGNNITGIKLISEFFRNSIPFFYQIFRFTFTKFSLGYVFFLSIGAGYFWFILFTRIKKRWVNLIISSGLFCLIFFSFLWSVRPIFEGAFFYQNLRVSIPQDYFQARDFFNTVPSNERILLLPLNGMWGWTTNDWGYRGSGFFWQMIPQPTLDRAFDAWSLENETLYAQLNKAIQDQNSAQVENLISKYDVKWVLIDKSSFELGETLDQRNIKVQIAQNVMNQLGFQKIQTFGKIEIYSTKNIVNNSTANTFQNKYPIEQIFFDPASEHLSNYVQINDHAQQNKNTNNFPFEFLNQYSISTKQIEETDNFFNFSISNDGSVTVPSFSAYEKQIPTTISGMKVNDQFIISIHPLFPQFSGKDLPPPPSGVEKQIKIPVTKTNAQGIIVEIGGKLLQINNSTDSTKSAETISLPLEGEIPVKIFSVVPESQSDQTLNYSTLPVRQCWFYPEKVWYIDKLPDFTLKSKNASSCVSQLIDKSSQKNDFLLKIDGIFKSTNKESGRVCIRYSNSYGCLNTQETQSKGDGFYSFSTHYTLDHQDYSVDAMNEVQQLDAAETTQFVNITFSSYPFLSTQTIDLKESTDTYEKYYQSINQQLLNSSQNVSVVIPKDAVVSFSDLLNSGMNTGLNCDLFQRGSASKQLTTQITYRATQKATVCDRFQLPTLNKESSYLVKLNATTSAGSGMSGYFKNESANTKDLEFSIPEAKNSILYMPLIPSSQKMSTNQGFDLFLSIPSYGNEANTVNISDLTILELPIKWLTHFQLKSTNISTYQLKQISSDKNSIFYRIPEGIQANQVLLLDEAFDPGWIAVTKQQPLQKLEHIKVNGWANGWIVSGETKQEILVFYWPQLLEFAGFGMLVTSLFFLAAKWIFINRKK